MPDSYWTDRVMQELEKFSAHPLVRKHVAKDLLRAMDVELERLFDLCVKQQAAE